MFFADPETCPQMALKSKSMHSLQDLDSEVLVLSLRVLPR